MKKFAAAFFLIFVSLSTARAADHWVLVPGRTFGNMLGAGGVMIMNTETLIGPDGRKVLVNYLKTPGSVYRCLNYDGESIQQSSLGCYQLVK